MMWDHPLGGMFEPLPGLPEPPAPEPEESDGDD